MNRIVIPAVIVAILAGATGTAFYYVDDPDQDDIIVTDDSTSVLEIHSIDVGQGDSTLVLTPSGYTILVDGGNNWKGDILLIIFLTKNL